MTKLLERINDELMYLEMKKEGLKNELLENREKYLNYINDLNSDTTFINADMISWNSSEYMRKNNLINEEMNKIDNFINLLNTIKG